jgi:hypothetical protein
VRCAYVCFPFLPPLAPWSLGILPWKLQGGHEEAARVGSYPIVIEAASCAAEMLSARDVGPEKERCFFDEVQSSDRRLTAKCAAPLYRSQIEDLPHSTLKCILHI